MPRRLPPSRTTGGPRSDARRQSLRAPGAAHDATAADRRQVRRALAALNLGATSAAALGGLACYGLVSHFGMPSLVAGAIGLVFALLGRLAMVALGHEWLLRSAAGHQLRDARAPHTSR